MNPSRRVTVVIALSCLLVLSVWTAPVAAIVPPDPSALTEKVFRHPDLHISNLERPGAELGPPVSREDLGRQLGRLGAQSGLHDWRSGRWGSLVLSVPLLPGDGVGNALGRSRGISPTEAWSAVSGYLQAHQGDLRVDVSELPAPRVAVFDEGALVQVHAARVVGGIPVRESGLSAVVSHGNLVLLGLHSWGTVSAAARAAVTVEAAAEVVAKHVHPFAVAAYREPPRLERVPLARGHDVATVIAGRGYDYRLAWVLTPVVDGDVGTWEALVDARTRELIAFQDTNAYAVRRVVGGVYPVTNDQQPPGGVERPGWPMPFADVAGSASTFTTTGGLVDACEEGAIQTTLDGQFVRIADACGPIGETSAAGDVDLGISGGTDCVVPAGHSAGDTHAARTAFYELNRIKEQARGHVTSGPGSVWLNDALQANTNVDQSCSAFWNGTAVSYFRENSNPICRNPGENAGVVDHEFGHGVDDNDTNGAISNPGEGLADIFANLRLNVSCVGRGIFKTMVCGGYGDQCDGTAPTGCTGVRDQDWLLHRCDRPHTISWILSGFTSAQCNGTGPAPACAPSSPGGPCGRVVHCESMVVGETAWDLHFRDLRDPPFSLDAHTALELATRLFYLGSQLVGSWYSCSAGGGCGATAGYMQVLAADDDNGNLLDGTPHMSAIRAAFERHEIHCTTPPVANSGCAGGPVAAPVVTATPTAGGADLSWAQVAGAASYAVYKTEGVNGCDFGKVKIGETAATRFSDSGLLDGRAYFYSVLPIGGNSSCFGLMSACAPVVPLLPTDPCVPVELQHFAIE